MAESGLSLAWANLQQEVGQFIGIGRTVANFSAAEAALVSAIVQSGIRRVYYPQGVQGIPPGYEWTFLRPTATLYLGANGTDGVVSGTSFDSASYTDWTTYGITAGTDTCDISAGTGPTLAEYAIQTVAAGQLTLTSAPGDGTSLTFFVTRDPANYTLPDSFGRVIGKFHYQADDFLREIEIVPEGLIHEMRARGDITGAPYYAATREKSSDGSAGQRREVLFYPRPDKAYILTYKFEAYAGALSDSYPYPLGGMQMSELYLESCLAIAEQRVNDEAGIHTQLFQALLVDAIARDRKREGHVFGRMGNREPDYDDRYGHGFRRGYGETTYSISYGGESV